MRVTQIFFRCVVKKVVDNLVAKLVYIAHQIQTEVISVVLLNCRVVREKKGLTLFEVASSAGCSVTTIQNAEKGRGVYRNTAKRIAAALGEKLENVVGRI